MSGVPPVMTRAWAMPNADTFSIKPIRAFIDRWLRHPSVDPFARNSDLATYTNDLSPNTTAQSHMDAAEYCAEMAARDIAVECVLFDPPYSPRQITEVYQSVGRKVTTRDTQSARMKREVRDVLDDLLMPGGVVLSFGWNSVGFGITRGYTLAEVLIVCHGGDHNDTICIAEIKNG